MSLIKFSLAGMLAFSTITVAVQSISHFYVNAAHYGVIPFTREHPIMWMGILVTLLQGITASYLFASLNLGGTVMRFKGFKFALLMFVFFVGYPAITEPAKYQVEDISAWFVVEATSGFIQFMLFGLALAWIASVMRITQKPSSSSG